eukprot:6973800-Karenia_brevis.AAC.1
MIRNSLPRPEYFPWDTARIHLLAGMRFQIEYPVVVFVCRVQKNRGIASDNRSCTASYETTCYKM